MADTDSFYEEFNPIRNSSHIAGGLDEQDDIRELLHSTRNNERDHFARSFEEGDEDASSFNDDEPPESETEYFSDEFTGLQYAGWEKPLTRAQYSLNARLAKYTPNEYRDSESEMDLKHRKQQAILKQHLADLLHKRNVKALARIEAAKNNNFELLEHEAEYLMAQEILDKKLDRPFYYTPNEPLYFKNILRQRVNAIKKKYEAYANDRNMRDEIERKVYDNMLTVNMMQNAVEQDVNEYTIEVDNEIQGQDYTLPSSYGQQSSDGSHADDSDPFGGNFSQTNNSSVNQMNSNNSININYPSAIERPVNNNNNFDFTRIMGGIRPNPSEATMHQKEVTYTIKMPSAMSMLHLIRCALGEVHLRKQYSEDPAQYNVYLDELNELLSQVLTLTHM